jgi:flagellar biosynthetic protein FliR
MIDLTLDGQKFILVFFRVVSALWLLPLFDSRAVSTAFKAVLSLSIAYLLYENVQIPGWADPVALMLCVLKEMLIGITMGFFVRTMFAAVSSAGELIAMQAGLTFARSLDPTMMTETTIVERLQSTLAILVFLTIDGHHILLATVARTLKYVPCGPVEARQPMFQYMIETTGRLFGASLKVCAPVIATLFITELALGILARLIPQVNVLVEGASVKILMTLAVFTISLNLLVPVIAGLFRGMDGELLKVIRLAM